MRPEIETTQENLHNAPRDFLGSLDLESQISCTSLKNTVPSNFWAPDHFSRKKCDGRIEGLPEYFPNMYLYLHQVPYKVSFVMILGPWEYKNSQINLLSTPLNRNGYG